MSTYKEEEKSLTKAKMNLMSMSNTIFYTTILFSLKHEFTTKISTACTDGYYLKINPNFWNSLNLKQQIGLLVHEVLHVALDHMGRLNGRDPYKWNIAGDIVIDNMLFENGYEMCPGDKYQPKYKRLSTEEVYAKLPNKPKSSSNNPNGKGSGNDVIYPDQNNSNDIKEIQHHVTNIVLRAKTQTNMCSSKPGNLPGEIELILDQKLNPKLPWNTILHNYINAIVKKDFTFQKPNKRFFPEYYLPSAHSEGLVDIAIAVDCSISVSDDEFNYFISEINSIQQNLQPDRITIINFDTEIQEIQELNEYENAFQKLKFTGRGGTQVKCVMDWVNKNSPNVILIFTDGEFYIPKKPNNNVPVIWLIHDDPKWECDYGKVINYDI